MFEVTGLNVPVEVKPPSSRIVTIMALKFGISWLMVVSKMS